MNVLKLNSKLTNKLNRLNKKVGQLYFLGEDINYFGDMPMVAIVGTRKPTPQTRELTTEICDKLAKSGVVVISGLALGTDGIAHDATVKSGGKTIAVMPSGLDKLYPVTNQPIAKRILDSGGAIISEYPKGHRPRKADFLERNRIIAALSDLVIIPEASAQSGSLNTANNSYKIGIPIAVVPGDIKNSQYAGTNKLLIEGKAHAIACGDDVLRILGIEPKTPKQTELNLETFTDKEAKIISAISQGAQSIDEIGISSRIDTQEIQRHITMLEVQGTIKQDSQGKINLI